MAIMRRRKAPMNVDTSCGIHCALAHTEIPLLSALFLIYFDNKTGYAISWKRSLPGVEIEGVVEYKSLPSGLHSVKQDLIYFVHGNYAGLSAFINVPAAEESRNARMIAVGALVPNFQGRLGNCWKHAEELKKMASVLIVDAGTTQILEDYWEEYKTYNVTETCESRFVSSAGLAFKSLPSTPRQPRSYGRSRSASEGVVLQSWEQTPGSHHPVLSMAKLLDTFGPLIFPIYRAALLRKRILISTHAPLHETCNFVYDLSVLSSIPQITRQFIDQNEPPQPLRPLFSIGVHDINFLEEEFLKAKTTPLQLGAESSKTDIPCNGWIACTTDSILATKRVLYDVLVNIPAVCPEKETEKVWPKIEWPPGVELRATQRDFRRYIALRANLRLLNLTSQNLTHNDSAISNKLASSDEISCNKFIAHDYPTPYIPDMKNIVEPISWSELARSSFMPWSIVDEQCSDIQKKESESALSLLSDVSSIYLTPKLSMPPSCLATTPENASIKLSISARQQMAIVTYFNRLTSQYFTILDSITDSTELEDEQYDENNPLHCTSEQSEYEPLAPIYVRSSDISKMGLDIWSDFDHQFIQNLTLKYFGRRARIESNSFKICGIEVC